MKRPQPSLRLSAFLVSFLLSGCYLTRQGSDSNLSNAVLATTFPAGSAYHDTDLDNLTTYDISLKISPGLDGFTAEQRVGYTHQGKEPTDHLIFHVFPNSKFLMVGGQRNIAVTEVAIDGKRAAFDLSGTMLRVPLGEKLQPGRRVQAVLRFTGRAPQLPYSTDLLMQGLQQLFEIIGGGGKASGNYGLYGLSGGILSLGHWHPIIPRLRGNEFDTEEPSGIGDVADFEVANYQVDVTAPVSAVLVSSGETVSESKSGSTKTVRYHGGAMRDFAVSCSPKYQAVTQVVDDIRLNSFYLPEHKDGGVKVLDYAAKALRFYRRAFGTYAYRELDVVEAPLRGGAGGMEYPAMVTIAHLFYDPNSMGASVPGLGDLLKSSPTQDMDGMMGEMLEFIVAHEVAHQWWHAMVGSDSKEHPFIDEALANYTSILYFEEYYGKAAADKQVELQMKLNYQMHRAMGGADHAVDQPAASFGNNFAYAAIVYGKGALYFKALRDQVGKEAFIKMMRTYADRFRFRIAQPSDLQKAIDDALIASRSPFTPQKSQLLARRWLYESHGDEDIGTLQFGKLIEMIMPPEFLSTPEGKQMKQLMDTLGPLLMGMLGGGLGGGEGAPEQMPDLEQLLKMLQGLGGQMEQ